MKKNLFEMGAKFDEGWSSDNKQKSPKQKSFEKKEPTKHRLYFAKEKRRGKSVTIIKPFFLEQKELQRVLKTLKAALGSGGTIKENTLELQGEVAERAKVVLEKEGFRFK